MILTCPECATRYDVDAAKFPAAGRKVRCKKCAHVWFQPGPESESVAPPEPEEAPVPQEQPEPPVAPPAPEYSEPSSAEAASDFADEDVDDDADDVDAPRVALAPRRPAPVRGAAAIAGWAALVGVILVIGWAATSYHQQIAMTWPKSASLFSHLGMAVNTRGLDFADIRHSRQSEDGHPVLVITGKLVNVSTRQIKVPSLRVTLSNAASRAIYGWSFSPGTNLLAPGQSLTFRTRLSDPPAAAARVDIRFADSAE
jgi:predicted Zn finger-like uncharacterized protein